MFFLVWKGRKTLIETPEGRASVGNKHCPGRFASQGDPGGKRVCVPGRRVGEEAPEHDCQVNANVGRLWEAPALPSPSQVLSPRDTFEKPDVTLEKATENFHFCWGHSD